MLRDLVAHAPAFVVSALAVLAMLLALLPAEASSASRGGPVAHAGASGAAHAGGPNSARSGGPVPGRPNASLIGSWGVWRAATHRAGKRLVCYAYTRSLSSSPALVGRGDVVLTITERSGAPRDAIAMSAGYAYPAGAEVAVTAGHARLRFYTSQRSAFARAGTTAARAFDGADRAVVRSPAPRGRSVTDVFGLDGFGDAHRAIEKACPFHA